MNETHQDGGRCRWASVWRPQRATHQMPAREDTTHGRMPNHTASPQARRVPIPLVGKVKEELPRSENTGIIETIKEPTDWRAPTMPVTRSQKVVRVCTDFRPVIQAVVSSMAASRQKGGGLRGLEIALSSETYNMIWSDKSISQWVSHGLQRWSGHLSLALQVTSRR